MGSVQHCTGEKKYIKQCLLFPAVLLKHYKKNIKKLVIALRVKLGEVLGVSVYVTTPTAPARIEVRFTTAATAAVFTVVLL